VLPAAAKLSRLHPGRVTQDSGLRRQLGQLEVDEGDDLAPGVVARHSRMLLRRTQRRTQSTCARHHPAPESSSTNARLASVEAQLRDIARALRKGMAPPARPRHQERPGHQGRQCFCWAVSNTLPGTVRRNSPSTMHFLRTA
jgi:hypothetical protein